MSMTATTTPSSSGVPMLSFESEYARQLFVQGGGEQQQSPMVVTLNRVTPPPTPPLLDSDDDDDGDEGQREVVPVRSSTVYHRFRKMDPVMVVTPMGSSDGDVEGGVVVTAAAAATTTPGLRSEKWRPTHSVAAPTSSTTRWRRPGRLTRLGPAKRAARLSSEGCEESGGDVVVSSEASPNEDNDKELSGSVGIKLSPILSVPTSASVEGIQNGIKNLYDRQGPLSEVPRNIASTMSPVHHSHSAPLSASPRKSTVRQDKENDNPAHNVTSPAQLQPSKAISIPPPKMSALLEQKHNHSTSSTTTSTKKGTVTLNGRTYIRLDTIGRGGSSKVYKVMTSASSKFFALKKVSFDKADSSAIVGYKNEIALLRKLGADSSERIVRLYDFEVNDSKGYLMMLMECGEIDFAHLLQQRSTVPLSLNFVRYYWEQMLLCVAAIHSEKIVHSDLKPANFLLVSGRLKLIDFGIAKAIGNDTTNISRDQQVGTVNYMSPEAILDTNYNQPSGAPRLMKLGRPSDVWSLGCILYQMVYGKTPFSHLTMYQKIQVIPNSSYHIEFPSLGVGGVTVAKSLKRCLVGCLERDARARMTIDELLHDSLLEEQEAHDTADTATTHTVQISLDQIKQIMEQTLSAMQSRRSSTSSTTDMLHPMAQVIELFSFLILN